MTCYIEIGTEDMKFLFQRRQGGMDTREVRTKSLQGELTRKRKSWRNSPWWRRVTL